MTVRAKPRAWEDEARTYEMRALDAEPAVAAAHRGHATGLRFAAKDLELAFLREDSHTFLAAGCEVAWPDCLECGQPLPLGGAVPVPICTDCYVEAEVA